MNMCKRSTLLCLPIAFGLAGCSLFESDESSSEEADVAPEEVAESEPNDSLEGATVVAASLPSTGALEQESGAADLDYLQPLEGKGLLLELDATVQVAFVGPAGQRVEFGTLGEGEHPVSLPEESWAVELAGSGQWRASAVEDGERVACGVRAPNGVAMRLSGFGEEVVRICVGEQPQRVVWGASSSPLAELPTSASFPRGAFTVDLVTDTIVTGHVRVLDGEEVYFRYDIPRNPQRAPLVAPPPERERASIELEIASSGVVEQSVSLSIRSVPEQPAGRLVALEPDAVGAGELTLRAGEQLLGQLHDSADRDIFALSAGETAQHVNLRVVASGVDAAELVEINDAGEARGERYRLEEAGQALELCALPLRPGERVRYQLSPVRLADESDGGYQVIVAALEDVLDEVEPNDDVRSLGPATATRTQGGTDLRNRPVEASDRGRTLPSPAAQAAISLGHDVPQRRGIIQQGGDRDLYWLVVDVGDDFVPAQLALTPEGPVDLSLRLLDEDEIPVATSNSGGSGAEETITVPLPTGRYLVEVAGSNVEACEGFYALRATRGDRGAGDHGEPDEGVQPAGAESGERGVDEPDVAPPPLRDSGEPTPDTRTLQRQAP